MMTTTQLKYTTKPETNHAVKETVQRQIRLALDSKRYDLAKGYYFWLGAAWQSAQPFRIGEIPKPQWELTVSIDDKQAIASYHATEQAAKRALANYNLDCTAKITKS